MSTRLEFTGEIAHDLEVVRTILAELPPSMRSDAKKAAVLIENAMVAVKRDFGHSPAGALGMAFAIFTIAQRLIQAEQEGPRSERLIQLLS
ncbi:MAG: hypothetical protein KGL39_09665 [Patescibacteria group bacterium]|nr:hypothetical protein [Patescibacteria group bacterium]